MDIDLLFTKNGDAGLICSENLVKKASGLILDTRSGLLTLEYADTDFMDLNIPVDGDFFETLGACGHLHLGAIKLGQIAQAYQIPLMFQDDPYRDAGGPPPTESLNAFGMFIKACVTGQPVHRDDLGNESSMACVLGEASPDALQFAPHLERRQGQEAKTGKPGRRPAPKNPKLG